MGKAASRSWIHLHFMRFPESYKTCMAAFSGDATTAPPWPGGRCSKTRMWQPLELQMQISEDFCLREDVSSIPGFSNLQTYSILETCGSFWGVPTFDHQSARGIPSGRHLQRTLGRGRSFDESIKMFGKHTTALRTSSKAAFVGNSPSWILHFLQSCHAYRCGCCGSTFCVPDNDIYLVEGKI
jgi:hypothetical protein